MPLQFNRVARVQINGRNIAGLRTRFIVSKDRSSTPNSMTVQLTNPAGSTVNAANTGTLRVFAGYIAAPPLLCAGEIAAAQFARNPPDTQLVMEAQEAVNTLRERRVSLSFEAGASVRQVIDALAEALAVPVRPLQNIDLTVPFRGGFAHVGGIGEALDVAVARVRGHWSVQNGELQLMPRGAQTQRLAPVLTPASGLLYSPQRIETRVTSEDASARRRTGWRIRALLQPDLQPGDPVRILSEAVTGQFVVDSLTHRGDTHGSQWETEAVVLQ